MHTLSKLFKRSQPYINHHRYISQIQRLHTRHVSTTTTGRSPSAFSRWILPSIAVAVGSTIGSMYWSSDSDDKSFLPSWSTVNESISAFDKLSLPDYSSGASLFGDKYRRKVFFKYEKRIRLLSPPEKVFEYFASYKAKDGELLMRPVDLMRAVVPVFPPSESNLVRDGFLIGERRPGDLHCAPSEFFMLFDVNNDDFISFKEYIFFVTLLSIPESSFSVAFKMFDVNNNGEIDKEEFKKVMSLMRSHNRQGAVHKDGRRPGLKVHGSVEDGGLVEYFFGESGKNFLQHDKFIQFMRDLHDEILRLEFAHYDYKMQGSISAKDFALSMVASADMSYLDKLLKSVDELDNNAHLRDIRITEDEFKDFAHLRKELLPFSLALFSHGKVNGVLTKDDFQRAASNVCGISLSDNVVNIVFHVFDVNRDGSLSSDEFLRVLHKRQRDIAQPVESGKLGMSACCLNCASIP